jgi:hypothetical protein
MQPEGINSAKWFAYWVWRLGAASLRRVLAGLCRADGDSTKNRCIWTSSARFRDEIQRVCLMAGYTAHFRCAHKAAGRQLGSVLCRVRRLALGREASKPNLFKARGEIRERKYTGRVWCFNMPSGFIWVRRVFKDEHGVVTKASRPLITGNCQGMGLKWTACGRRAFRTSSAASSCSSACCRRTSSRSRSTCRTRASCSASFADKWFMTWFLYTMPFHVVLRIWDGLLGHGFAFIYRAMLALFKLRQNDILESPFEDIVVILKFDGEIGGQTDENKLIETAMSLRIKQEEIDALHAEWAAMKTQV